MVPQRIKEFIDWKGIAVSAFEKSLGMSNASFGKSLKNGGAIGSDKLEKILIFYPEINAEWLLTGRGEMTKITTCSTPHETVIGDPKDRELIELQRKTIALLEEKLERIAK